MFRPSYRKSTYLQTSYAHSARAFKPCGDEVDFWAAFAGAFGLYMAHQREVFA